MQENRENLAQQAHLAQRNIQQGATSRGLGSSGLRNLASLQAQTAQGDALRRLAGDDAQIQREALDTRIALSEQLAQQMSGSEINYLQALLDTDRFGLERSDMDRDTLLQLIEMSQVDGADPDLLDKMAQIALGEGYKDLMSQLISDQGGDDSGDTNPFADLIGSDEYGDERLGRTTSNAWTKFTSFLDPTKYVSFGVSKLLDGLFRDPANRKNRTLSEAVGLSDIFDNALTGTGGKRDYYMVDGKRVRMTKDEVLDLANQWHGNKSLVKNNTIKIKLVNGNVKYEYKGKNYGTYNAAKDAYDIATGNK